MKNYYVYILKCKDHSFYVGVTNNITRRYNEHQSGHDSKAYTFNKRPLELVYVRTFTNILKAIAYEKQLKGWSRKKKEALMNNEISTLKELSRCRASAPLSLTSQN